MLGRRIVVQSRYSEKQLVVYAQEASLELLQNPRISSSNLVSLRHSNNDRPSRSFALLPRLAERLCSGVPVVPGPGGSCCLVIANAHAGDGSAERGLR